MLSTDTTASARVVTRPGNGLTDTLTDALIVSIAAPGHMAGIPESVQWLEYRADVLGDDHPVVDELKPRRSLYGLRSRDSGGYCDSPHPERRERLIRAASRHDLVELEFERDLVPSVLTDIPAHKRVIAWYGSSRSAQELTDIFGAMARYPASLYRVAPAAQRLEDGIAPLALCRAQKRRDLIAYASGTAGTWTRLLSLSLGSPKVFARVASGEAHAEPGTEPVSRLIENGFGALPCPLRVYGIVGPSAHRSLSPVLHGWMYRRSNLPAIYLPFTTDASDITWLKEFGNRVHERLGVRISGVTVMAPYKESALRLGGPTRTSQNSQAAAAANILVRKNGHWHADTTDVAGIVEPIQARRPHLAGCRVAIIGCGGAGRAAAVGLLRAAADVVLINRGEERGRSASALLGVPFFSLESFDPGSADIVINATPVGTRDASVPFDVHRMRPDAMVVDMVYRTDSQTELIARARERGLETIDGREVLRVEVRAQFTLMTGLRAPGLDRRSIDRVTTT